jgi:hypothetical protein
MKATKFTRKERGNSPSLEEMLSWNNPSLWIKISKKWFTLFEWLTLLAILEFVKIKTNSWQITIFLFVSWGIIYAYIFSAVIMLAGKLALKHKSLALVPYVLSSSITACFYLFVKEIVLMITKYY